jgi:hypothetical protein
MIPMVANADTFIKAKETPITKNNNLKYQNPLVIGITAQIMVTINNAINIDFFKPIFGKKEANKKEAKAIGKSLKPSKTEASALEISKLRCICKITVPTLFNKIAKTK